MTSIHYETLSMKPQGGVSRFDDTRFRLYKVWQGV